MILLVHESHLAIVKKVIFRLDSFLESSFHLIELVRITSIVVRRHPSVSDSHADQVDPAKRNIFFNKNIIVPLMILSMTQIS